MKVRVELGVAKDLRMALAQILTRRHEKAASAAGRVADARRPGFGRDQLDHQPNDMARRAKLAVLTGAGDLGEHVLVQVALGVALLHRHLVDHIDDLRQQAGVWNREARVFHVMRVGRLVAAQSPQKRKHMLANHRVHVSRREMLEARPTIVRVGTRRPRMVVIAFRKQAALDGRLQPSSFQLFERLQLIQPLDEKQIGDLLDHFQRIGNPAGPKRIPDLIDLATNLGGKHGN